MSYYSTIINTNQAGRKDLVQQWLNDHRFFMGLKDNEVDIHIQDDLSLIVETKYMVHIGWPSISIHELPPYGIKEMRHFSDVTFVGVHEADINKLPRFRDCDHVSFEYCTLPKEYINKRMNIIECDLV